MMIFDRTAETVKEALRIREEKVKTNQELTAEEIEILNRGFLTTTTLNRIEAKQRELKEMFNLAGYWNLIVTNKEWIYSEIFDAPNFQRILSNLTALKEAFFQYVDTPQTPSVSYNFDVVNNIEKILYDLEQIYIDMQNKYRECGTFECGEESIN